MNIERKGDKKNNLSAKEAVTPHITLPVERREDTIVTSVNPQESAYKHIAKTERVAPILSLNKATETKPSRRPKEVIEADLETIQAKIDELEPEREKIQKRYGLLTEEQQEKIGLVWDNLQTADIPTDELHQTCSSELFQDILQIKEFEDKRRPLGNQERTLVRELLQEKTIEVSAKVDYDAIFSDFSKKENDKDSSQEFLNTLRDSYTLRYLRHNLSQSQSDEIADYPSLFRVKNIEASFKEKGFLLSEEQERADEFDNSPKEKRETLRGEVKTTLQQLYKYGVFVQVFRPTLKEPQGHTDHELESIYDMVLDISYPPGQAFTDIDFEPELIAAAKRHIDKKVLDHQRAGRLPKSAEVLAEERQRLEAIDIDEAFDAIQFNGFEPPEGMISLLDQHAFINNLKKVMPPDFVKDLTSISYIPDAKTESNLPGYVCAAKLVSIYGDDENTWDQIQETQMQLHASPFRPADMPTSQDILKQIKAQGISLSELDKFGPIPETRDSEQRELENNIMHELGHNSHLRLDYDEIVAWIKVEETDPTAVTKYVQQKRKANLLEGYRESFADSERFFSTDPLILKFISEPRYQYMDWFFRRHLSTQQLQEYENQKKKQEEIRATALCIKYPNKSVEEIIGEVKKEYLSHEQDNNGFTITIDTV